MPRVCLQLVIVVFPDTYYFFVFNPLLINDQRRCVCVFGSCFYVTCYPMMVKRFGCDYFYRSAAYSLHNVFDILVNVVDQCIFS